MLDMLTFVLFFLWLFKQLANNPEKGEKIN